MRTEVITRSEFNRAKMRALSFDNDSDFNARDFGYQLSLLEVPRAVASTAMQAFEAEQGVELRYHPHHNDEVLFGLVSDSHAHFLANATEEDRRRCFVEKALFISETEFSDEKWEEGFSGQLKEEFGVTKDLGAKTMRNTPTVRGTPWTGLVVDAILEMLKEHLDESPAPAL